MKQDADLGTKCLFLWLFSMLLVLSGCAQDPAPHPPENRDACSRIALQSTVWTPEITRDVFSCVLKNQNSEASFKLQELPSENFVHLSAYLSEAFQNPEKKKQLARLLSRTREASPIISQLLREDLILELTSKKSFVSSIPWVLQSFQSIRNIVVEKPEVLIDWARSWNRLDMSGPFLRELHPPMAELLNGVSDPSLNTAALLGMARAILGDISQSPETVASLSVLSGTQICQSTPQRPVYTQSPLELSLEFFRSDRKNPENFVNSLQQGFNYWSRVCRPQGETALTQARLNTALSWALPNWEILHNFVESEKSTNWIPAGKKLLQLADSVRPNTTESNALLSWIFYEEVPRNLVAGLQENPAALSTWIKGFDSLKVVIYELADTDLQFSEALLADLEENTSWSPWLDSASQMPPEVAQEIWSLAQTLSPSGVHDLADAWESAKTQNMIRFLEWVLNVRDRHGNEAAIVERVRPPVAAEERPVAEQLGRAQKLLKTCLNESSLDRAESCLERNGLPTSPPLVKELWKISNDSSALQSVHAPSVISLADPKLARPFWNPLLRWIRDTRVPLLPALDLLTSIETLANKTPEVSLDPLIVSFWSQFQKQLRSHQSPASLGLRLYRRERSIDMKVEFLSDPEMRAVLLNPTFLKRALKWFSSDATTLPSRRALVRTLGQDLSFSFWVQDQRQEVVKANPIEALDLLFWELQIPLISNASNIRGVLESWSAMTEASEIAPWLDTKDAQLGLAINLASIFGISGEGLVRRLENAQAIVRALKTETSLHADLFLGTRFLDLFKDSNGRISVASTKSIMALHQAGLFHLLSLTFDPASPWASRWQDPQTLPISDRTINALRYQLGRFVEKTPPADLREFFMGQMRQDYALTRAIVGGAFNAVHENPSALLALDKTSSALMRIFDEAHTKVLLPWALAQRGKSASQRDQEMILLKKSLLGLDKVPSRSWLKAASELSKSGEVAQLWPELTRLNDADLAKLIRWLESGIPARLLLWNRLMRVQNPDGSASLSP